MSETLIGVVVGAFISGLGTWITLAVQHRRWVTEARVKRLEAKRDRLEAASTRILDELSTAMAARSYPSMMTSEINVLFPATVSTAFDEMIEDKDKSDSNMRSHYYLIALAMRKSLRDLDDQVDEIVLGNRIPIFKAK